MTELYTRCPHCHTVFKLHTAQLDAAGGKVRCGACLHVFVAKEHLVRPKQAAATAPSASSDAPSERPKPSVANRESMPTPTPAVADRETKAPKPTAVFEARPVSTKPQSAPPVEKPAYAATEKQVAEKTPIVVAPKIENTAPSVAATTASSSNAKVAHRSDHKTEMPAATKATNRLAEASIAKSEPSVPKVSAPSASTTSAHTVTEKDFSNPFAAFEQFDLLTPVANESRSRDAAEKHATKATPTTASIVSPQADITPSNQTPLGEMPIDKAAPTARDNHPEHTEPKPKATPDPFVAFSAFENDDSAAQSHLKAKEDKPAAPLSTAGSKLGRNKDSSPAFEITNTSKEAKTPVVAALDNDWDQLKSGKKDRVEPVFDDNNGLDTEELDFNSDNELGAEQEIAPVAETLSQDVRLEARTSTKNALSERETDEPDEMPEVHFERSPFAMEQKPKPVESPIASEPIIDADERFVDDVDITQEIIIPESLVNEAIANAAKQDALNLSEHAEELALDVITDDEASGVESDEIVIDDIPDLEVIDDHQAAIAPAQSEFDTSERTDQAFIEPNFSDTETHHEIELAELTLPEPESAETDFSDDELSDPEEMTGDTIGLPTAQEESNWGDHAPEDIVISNLPKSKKKQEISKAAKDVDFGETDDNWVMPSAKLQTVDIANAIKPKATPAKEPQRFSAKNEGELAIERDWHIEALEAHGFESDLLQDPKPRSYKGLMWAALALLLMSGLAAQYFWSHRVELREDPQWSATVESVCQYVECSLPPRRDLSKIQLKQKSVIKERDDPTKLKIDLLIINNASFDQFYPDMLVRFTNIEGKIVAEDRFAPKEYLRELPQDHLMPAGIPVHVSFMVKSPSTTVTGYEFQFLPSVAKP